MIDRRHPHHVPILDELAMELVDLGNDYALFKIVREPATIEALLKLEMFRSVKFSHVSTLQIIDSAIGADMQPAEVFAGS